LALNLLLQSRSLLQHANQNSTRMTNQAFLHQIHALTHKEGGCRDGICGGGDGIGCGCDGILVSTLVSSNRELVTSAPSRVLRPQPRSRFEGAFASHSLQTELCKVFLPSLVLPTSSTISITKNKNFFYHSSIS